MNVRLIIAAIICAFLFECAAVADLFCWKVSDGDTIWVADENGKRKVRMVDIDAPEMNQPYGVQAADRLAELVLGKYVTLKPSGTDQYGRSLETVFIGTTNINLQLVAEGLAWRYYTCKDKAYVGGIEANGIERNGHEVVVRTRRVPRIPDNR